jgi:hypothetical protein
MHPNKPALFILAAAHELEHHSPSAARMLLQRGLRLNGESIALWKEYVKMELGFVESLRRRWDVLGLRVPGTDKDKEEEKKRAEDPSSAIMGERIADEALEAGAAAAAAAYEAEDAAGAAARRQVLEGAIVESVISSAGKGAYGRVHVDATLRRINSGASGGAVRGDQGGDLWVSIGGGRAGEASGPPVWGAGKHAAGRRTRGGTACDALGAGGGGRDGAGGRAGGGEPGDAGGGRGQGAV